MCPIDWSPWLCVVSQGWVSAPVFIGVLWATLLITSLSSFITKRSTSFCCGCDFKRFRTNSSTCPFAMPLNIRSSAPICRAGQFHPLFMLLSVQLLDNCYVKLGWMTHKICHTVFVHIGPATTLAAAGLPEGLIKSLGRWSSNAHLSSRLYTPATILDFGNLQVVLYRCF